MTYFEFKEKSFQTYIDKTYFTHTNIGYPTLAGIWLTEEGLNFSWKDDTVHFSQFKDFSLFFLRLSSKEKRKLMKMFHWSGPTTPLFCKITRSKNKLAESISRIDRVLSSSRIFVYELGREVNFPFSDEERLDLKYNKKELNRELNKLLLEDYVESSWSSYK